MVSVGIMGTNNNRDLSLSNRYEVFKEKELEILGGYDEHKRELARKLSQALDETNELTVAEFGASLQTKLGKNSEEILSKTSIGSVDEVGVLLNDLMYQLQSTSESTISNKVPKGFFQKLLKKAEKSKFDLESNYLSVSDRVNQIKLELGKQQEVLYQEVGTIQEMIEKNQQLEIATDIYVKSGELKIAELKEVVIPDLREKLNNSNQPEIEQDLMEKVNYLERLEKRVMDLMLTQSVLKQSFPQLSLMKNSAYILSDKINSSIQSAIPLWQSQITITIGLKNQAKAIDIQKRVTDATNSLARHNADMLHQTTTDTARANERGVIDLDTLEYTQQKLIATIKDTLEVQQQGISDRENAKIRLREMENEMKNSLREMVDGISDTSKTRKTATDATQRLTEPTINKKRESYEDLL